MGKPKQSGRSGREGDARERKGGDPPADAGTALDDAGRAEAAAARAVEEGLEQERAVTDELRAELEELTDRHLRLAAEFENYRKRTRQELLKTRQLAQAELARRLLDALDDLRRIVELPHESATLEALREGVALVERKLLKELGEAGLEPIDAEGRRFDPNEHEALSRVPTSDPGEDQVVSDVFLRGYRFGDRLLRPARVAVKTLETGASDGERARAAASGPAAGDEAGAAGDEGGAAGDEGATGRGSEGPDHGT